MLDAHTAVEASTLFSRNLVVEESHLQPHDVLVESQKLEGLDQETTLPAGYEEARVLGSDVEQCGFWR